MQNAESTYSTQKTTTRKRRGKTANQSLKKPKLSDECRHSQCNRSQQNCTVTTKLTRHGNNRPVLG